jgi:hypothetical protein
MRFIVCANEIERRLFPVAVSTQKVAVLAKQQLSKQAILLYLR